MVSDSYFFLFAKLMEATADSLKTEASARDVQSFRIVGRQASFKNLKRVSMDISWQLYR